MDLGKLVRKVERSGNSVLREVVIGVIASSLFFIKPIKENLLVKYTFYGISSDYFLLIAGILLVIIAIFRYVKTPQNSTVIEIYEDGLKIGSFESTFTDLTIRTKGHGFIFSNEAQKINYMERLTKTDYKYLKGLG